MDFLLSLLQSVSTLGGFGYAVAFSIAFIETLPFLGILFPGTMFLVLFGFFASQGYLRFDILIPVVFSGAFLGDLAGYVMGVRRKESSRTESRIFRAFHIRKAERYLARHGEAAVFFGRFSESIRPVIPFVTGRSGLSLPAYLSRSVPAALAWSWVVLAVGFLFGGAVTAIGTWFSRVSVVFLFLFVLLAFLWFVAERSQPFLRLSKSVIRSVLAAFRDDPGIRRFLDRHPDATAFLRRRLGRRDFSGLPLSLLSLVLAYVLFLLYGTTEGVLTAEPIVSVDERIFNLMYAFRDPGFVAGFLWITLIGRSDMVLAAALSVSAVLILHGRRSAVWSLWLVLGGTQLSVTLGKRLFERPRPDFAYYLEPSFSFPSGHAALSTALAGYVAYVVLRGHGRKWRYRTSVLFLALSVSAAVGLSRLYLGVHYASDVWAGHLLGALWLLIGIRVAEIGPKRGIRDIPVPAAVRRLPVSVVPVVLFVAFFAYQGVRYELFRPLPSSPPPSVATDDVLRSFSDLGLPRFSETFSGAYQEPMNFIVVARDEETFVFAMEEAGWLRSDPVTVPNMARLVEASMSDRRYPRAPMTPSFWNTQVHDPGFQKETDDGSVHARHHARFWKTPIRMEDGAVIYVGTASLDTEIKWVVTHRIDPDIDTERETLFGDLDAAGVVASFEKIRFVDPVLGRNFSGDPFFTDGEAYLLRFR